MRPLIYKTGVGHYKKYSPRPARVAAPVPLTAAARALVVENVALAHKVLRDRYAAYRSDPDTWEVLTAAALYGLCLAARGYDATRGKFSTYAYATVWGIVGTEIARYTGRAATGLDGTEFGDLLLCHRIPDQHAVLSAAETRDRVRAALGRLPARDGAILSALYGIDGPELDPGALAARLRVTRQRLHQLTVRARDRFLVAYRKAGAA